MPATLRPLVTAGVVLVGASVISVTPIEPLQPDYGPTERAVRLTAATAGCLPGDSNALCAEYAESGITSWKSPVGAAAAEDQSLLNVPVNLLNALLSMPAYQVQALDRFADAMYRTGSWQVWSPTNVFGFDEADPPKLKAIIDLLVPFPALSTVLGNHLSTWAQANLPMNAGCAALPGACPDPAMMLNTMFKVSLLDLYGGDYVFPVVENPFTGEPASWSQDSVDLNADEPITSVLQYLVSQPTGVESVTIEEIFATFAKVVDSVYEGFYPFVQNSEWYNPEQTGLAYFFRALSPILCLNCDPDNQYDNPYLYDNYPPEPPSTRASTGLPTTDEAPQVEGSSEAELAVTHESDSPFEDSFGEAAVGETEASESDSGPVVSPEADTSSLADRPALAPTQIDDDTAEAVKAGRDVAGTTVDDATVGVEATDSANEAETAPTGNSGVADGPEKSAETRPSAGSRESVKTGPTEKSNVRTGSPGGPA